MRQLKMEMPALQGGRILKVTDSKGRNWDVALELSDSKPGDEAKVILVLTELSEWIVRMEGVKIGSGYGSNPAEVAREVLAKSGLTSLPEAVPLFVVQDIEEIGAEQFVVFTLDGAAYCVPRIQFSEEVEKSGRWIQARQARRAEIDALKVELGKLPKK